MCIYIYIINSIESIKSNNGKLNSNLLINKKKNKLNSTQFMFNFVSQKKIILNFFFFLHKIEILF